MGRGLAVFNRYIKALFICTFLTGITGASVPAGVHTGSSLSSLAALSPNSKLKPLVSFRKDPSTGDLYISENPQRLKEIEHYNREETAFVYLSYLIGEMMYKYPGIIDEKILKKLIARDLGHIDFDKYLWKDIYRVNGYFYLPYLTAGEKVELLKYHIEKPDINKNPYSFLTEDKKARVCCDRVTVKSRKDTIREIKKEVSLMDNNKVSEGLRSRLKGKNVLFVSFRLDGTDLDGVSLEAEKWAKVMHNAGANIFYYSGQTKIPDFVRGGHTFPMAHFLNNDVETITMEIFREKGLNWGDNFYLVKKILKIRDSIKSDMKKYILENHINYLVYENILSYPGNIALSKAAMEVANELDIPVIAHDHDFYWEREKFRSTGKELRKFFNGMMKNIHILATTVISRRQVKDMEKIGLQDAIVTSNVMDFAHPPEITDNKRARIKERIRKKFGIKYNEFLLLAPVRPVARKFLKRAVKAAEEIAAKYNTTVNLMVTHPAGDEKDGEYWKSVKEYAKGKKSVRIIDASENVKAGEFSLEDSYIASDFVIYSSNWEGWGNVLCEAVYYKVPVIVYPYRVYRQDIKTKKPDFVEMLPLPGINKNEMDVNEDDFLAEAALSRESLDKIGKLKKDPRRAVEHNYSVFKEYFSYEVLKKDILIMLKNIYWIKSRLQYEKIVQDLDIKKEAGRVHTGEEPYTWYSLITRAIGKGEWRSEKEISDDMSSRLNNDFNPELMRTYLNRFTYFGFFDRRLDDSSTLYRINENVPLYDGRSLETLLLEPVYREQEYNGVRDSRYEKDIVSQLFFSVIRAINIAAKRKGPVANIVIAVNTEWIPEVLEESLMKGILRDKKYKNISFVYARNNDILARKISEKKAPAENVVVIGPGDIMKAKELQFLRSSRKPAFFAEVKLGEDFNGENIGYYYPLIEIINIAMSRAFGIEMEEKYPCIKDVLINDLARSICIIPRAQKIGLNTMKYCYHIQQEHFDKMA